MPKTTLKHEITIHALTTTLWRVLTCSDYTRQFLFSELVSDWIEGSPVISENEGLQKGIVHELVPGMRMRFSLDLPEFSHEPVQCQYELVPEENGIRLKLVQEMLLHKDISVRTINEHTDLMLQKIKWLAEYS